jgi:hypothetical protein
MRRHRGFRRLGFFVGAAVVAVAAAYVLGPDLVRYTRIKTM